MTPAVPAGAYAFKCIFDDASTVYQSIPSTFRFYSKSNMRVNRTDVKRIPINQDANITVFGSNLNQTGMYVLDCISENRMVFTPES